MKKQINEIKRMQHIAGLITESEYRQSLNEETNEETLDDVTFTLDMALNNMFPMYGFKAGDTVTGILPAEEFADETKRNSAEDFQAAQAYIKNKGGEIKINSSDPYLMFRNINITYKLKDNGDIEYAVEVPAKKMDEAEIKEEEKGLPFLLAKTWLNEYNGNIQFAVRTEEIIGFLYNLRNEEFKQYKGEIERMYLPYKKAKDAFEKLWDEASVYSDKDLKD
jgi:hypothetical protein